jgi:hypothetical protein
LKRWLLATGYLYCIYYVERHLKREIAPKLVTRLVKDCLESGLTYVATASNIAGSCELMCVPVWCAVCARARRRAKIEEAGEQHPPLMYTWDGVKYLGIAHGIAGVINALLLRPQELDVAAVRTHTILIPSHTG